MKRSFLILMLFLCGMRVSAQTSLTKAQMYEDFDQFVDIVQKYDAQIGVRKAVTGYDVMEHVLALRPQIDTISGYGSFLRLMKEATTSLIDIHARAVNVMTPRENIRYIVREGTLGEIDTIKTFKAAYALLKVKEPMPYGFGNYLIYHDGDYYFVGDVCLFGESRQMQFQNFKLKKIGGMSVDSFLVQSMPQQINHAIRWDTERRKYFSTNLVLPREKVTLENIRTGKDSTVDLALYTGFQFQPRKGTFSKNDFSKKSVHYFSEEGLLYVRFAQMYGNMQDELIRGIRKELKGKTPRKVVLDVRNNPGGGDDVWMDVLQYLTGDTICMPLKAAIKASPELLAFCQKGDSSQWEPYSYLGENFYALKDGVCLLKPAAKNCGYRGKFYVLQDRGTMSAAHSLSSLHRYCGRFVTVGEPTGTIAGRGCGPTLFQLKHSGYTFFMEFDIDFTNVHQPADAYQDAVDVPFRCTLEEAERDAISCSNRSKSFLRGKDPYFKKVLELE